MGPWPSTSLILSDKCQITANSHELCFVVLIFDGVVYLVVL